MNRPGLCFDATGTLIEMSTSVGEVYAELAARFEVALPAWRLDDAFRRIISNAPPRGIDGKSVSEREANEVEWWTERVRQTFQATDSTVRIEDLRGFGRALFDTYCEASRWRTLPGIPQTLARLAAAGHPMGIVSNFDHRLPVILEAMDINMFFSVVEIPSKHGARKPDRRLFEAAATTLARELGELVYIGDDEPAVLDAIGRLGIRVLDVATLDRFDALPDWLESPATLPVT